jgi:[NiFe] hydrogenase maturation protein HypF
VSGWVTSPVAPEAATLGEARRATPGRRIEIRGTVQGVGFRPWVYRLARQAGLWGTVRNDAAGVTIEAFGDGAALAGFCGRLETEAPPAARIRSFRWVPLEAPLGEPVAGPDFRIVASEGSDEKRLSIPPDLATCEACQREVANPANRRFGYAFTNCTDCGPRYTIATGVPYDRPATVMASFTLCPACRREYEDPDDRRFHAQPNACPVCGPRLWLAGPDGKVLATLDPVTDAARALTAGAVVAVKGLGGFHLACDATDGAAVTRLRRRKHREEKPFAVMVPDLATAHRLAFLSAEEERLLTSVERPIVLLAARREDEITKWVAPSEAAAAKGLAPAVAPKVAAAEGPGWVGLFLPYTPLHHRLLTAVGRPLVMTSGNRSGEPIAHRNEEAVERLGGLVDLFLLHNRPIAAPCDDSVTRVIAGAPTVLRRSRGYVPRPIPVPQPFAQPVLACGPQFKNTFCLGVGDGAYLGPHIGDLETLEGLEFFEAAVAHLEDLLGVHPAAIAHDLHPEFLSTRYARQRAAALGVPLIGVQHHHAHIVSCLAEQEGGLDPDQPVLGVVYDGVGYGAAEKSTPNPSFEKGGAPPPSPSGFPPLPDPERTGGPPENPPLTPPLRKEGHPRPPHGIPDSGLPPFSKGGPRGDFCLGAGLPPLPDLERPGGPRGDFPSTTGTAWGGEILWATATEFRRLATLRPLALVGGDVAVRQVWRLALALLDDAFAGFDDAPALDRFALFAAVPPTLLRGAGRMLRAGVNTPSAHGMGRLFDAVGALLLARPEGRFEGQVALALNRVAAPGGAEPYPFAVDFSGPVGQMDWRPLVRALVAEHLAGVPAPHIAARFHETVAAMTTETLGQVRRQARRRLEGSSRPLPVVLTGGCFQNALLTERLCERLRQHPQDALGADTPIFTHRRVPPGDGGIALGQAVVANALLTANRRRSPCV